MSMCSMSVPFSFQLLADLRRAVCRGVVGCGQRGGLRADALVQQELRRVGQQLGPLGPVFRADVQPETRIGPVQRSAAAVRMSPSR